MQGYFHWHILTRMHTARFTPPPPITYWGIHPPCLRIACWDEIENVFGCKRRGRGGRCSLDPLMSKSCWISAPLHLWSKVFVLSNGFLRQQPISSSLPRCYQKIKLKNHSRAFFFRENNRCEPSLSNSCFLPFCNKINQSKNSFAGWGGDNCDTRFDYCASLPCAYWSACSLTTAGSVPPYSCDCSQSRDARPPIPNRKYNGSVTTPGSVSPYLCNCSQSRDARPPIPNRKYNDSVTTPGSVPPYLCNCSQSRDARPPIPNRKYNNSCNHPGSVPPYSCDCSQSRDARHSYT